MTNLTFKELVHYLDFTSTDPMVRRLLEYINDKEESIVEGLVDVGMDPVEFRFDYDGYYYSPGQYIEQLVNDADYSERMAQEWEEKYYRMKEKHDRLQARSIADVLNEMKNQLISAEEESRRATRIAKKYEEENRELLEKINVWKILEKE